MNNTEKMLFLQQKFLILNQFSNEHSKRRVSEEYAFAWDQEIYPILSDGAPWHLLYDEYFSINKERMEYLHDYLCNNWNDESGLTFYEMESHFSSRGYDATYDRSELISACRYFHIYGTFDKDFWDKLLTNGECPSEAFSIKRDFEIGDIYFV